MAVPSAVDTSISKAPSTSLSSDRVSVKVPSSFSLTSATVTAAKSWFRIVTVAPSVTSMSTTSTVTGTALPSEMVNVSSVSTIASSLTVIVTSLVSPSVPAKVTVSETSAV